MGSKNYNPGRTNPGRNPNSVLPVGWNQGFFYEEKAGGNYMSSRKEKNFLRVLTS